MPKSRNRLLRGVSVVIWSLIPILALLIVLSYGGLSLIRHVYPPVVPVEGISMRPLLHFGDLVFLKKAEHGQLRKGDIIAFRTTEDVQQKWNVPNSYVHRIVTVEKGAYGQQFQTKGDNVVGKDPFWTVEQNVIGIYAGKISGGGYPILFARSREGKILLAGIVMIMFIYWMLGVFERRQSAQAVNIHSLSTIVDEARRITAKMEESVAVPTSHAPPAPDSEAPPPPIPSLQAAAVHVAELERETAAPKIWLESGDFLTGELKLGSPLEVVEAQRIARSLDSALERSHWPRYDVAARAEVSLPTVHAMLEGEVLPDFATVIRMSRLLGISIFPSQ